MITNVVAEKIVLSMLEGRPDIFESGDKAQQLEGVEKPQALVHYILGEFFTQRELLKSYMSTMMVSYDLLSFVENHADSTHMERICEMLSWDEFIPQHPFYSRGYTNLFLRILETIGNNSCVPAIEALAGRLKAVRYEGYVESRKILEEDVRRMNPDALRREDARIVARAIAACQARG